MRYAKIVDGKLFVAPNPLSFAGVRTYNPPDALFVSAGFLPVEDTPYPDDGGYYLSHWEEQDCKIVRVWSEVVLPEPEPEPKPIPTPELTPAQKREQAYNTEPVIEWDGNFLTVTQAAQQWAYYAAEGDEYKSGALTALIARAKQDIRERYPDEVTV